MNTNPITDAIKLILTTFIRYALVAVCAWLVKKGVMEQGVVDTLLNPTTIAAVAGAALVTLTGIYIRLKSRYKTNTALKMPSGSTPTELDQVVKQASVGEIITTAAPPQAVINSAAMNSK